MDIYNNIIEPNCIVCHSERGYHNYENVRLNSMSILKQVLSNRMPQDSEGVPKPLSKNLKTMLLEWVNAGAPEFGNKFLSQEE